jgi:hypothetical protein
MTLSAHLERHNRRLQILLVKVTRIAIVW